MSDILNEDECGLLDRLVEQRDLGTDELSGWEQDFLEDNLDRYDTYGDRTRFSTSQWEHLRKIADKLGVL